MLKLSLFLLFITSVLGQIPQTSTLWMEHKDGNSNFTVSMNPDGYVQWRWNELTYDVLGSTLCPAGQDLMRSGRNWICNPNTTGTGDVLVNIASTCTFPNNVPKSLGGGDYSCQADNDVLASIATTSCSAGQIPRRSGSTWVCDEDRDTIKGARLQCAGVGGGVPRIRNTTISSQAFACTPAWPDNDTARDLALSGGCVTGQVVKYNTNTQKWYCARDNSLLTYRTCAAGQILKRVAGNWTCANPADTLKTLSSLCNATHNTPYKSIAGWVCIPTPTVAVVWPNATVLQFATFIVGAGTSFPAASGSYTGTAGIPWYLPYQGKITGWAVRGYSAGSVTVELFSGSGSAADSMTLSGTTAFYNLKRPVNGVDVSNKTFGVRISNTGSNSVSIAAELYIQTFLKSL